MKSVSQQRKDASDANRPADGRIGKRRRYFTILLFFLSLIIAIGAFLWFGNANYRRIVSQNMRYIEDSALQEAAEVEHNLNNAETLVINAANQYSTLASIQPEMTTEELLNTIHDDNLFDLLTYISPEGLDIGPNGTADVSDRDYFINAMRGETGWQYTEESRLTHKPTVSFYAPIIIDGSIDGAMVGCYTDQRLKALFSNSVVNYTQFSYLFQPDGTVVACSRDAPDAENVLHSLSKIRFFETHSYQDVLDFIQDSTQPSLSFSYENDLGTVEATVIRLERNGWMLLNVLPAGVTAGMVNAANRIGGILEIILLGIFVLYVAVIFFIFRQNQKTLQIAVDNATGELRNTLQAERRQQAIIGSLASIYTHTFLFNLPEKSYRILRTTGDYGGAELPDEGSLDAMVQVYLSHLILPASLETMWEFMDWSTLNERLKDAESISVEYQRIDGKWNRGTFVVVEREENGDVKNAIYAVQIIDGEKQKELETQAALHDAYDAAQMASRAKTAFLSNMSHDMRTPMNAIIGMTAIAGAHLDDAEHVRECLRKITSSSKHLLALINEILDMSRIESGKVDLSEEEFSLSELIDNMMTLNHSLIAERHHTLTITLHDVTHEDVIGDSVRLQQVFTNLLSNAAKYTPDGGRIQIDFTEKEGGNDNTACFQLDIQDNGIGMSEEFLQQMFEPFSRADDELVGKVQGTGLGMPIARNIIRMMDGDIQVRSKLGEGSCFSVTFCLKIQNKREHPEDQFAGLSVLVVDDDQGACDAACLMLDSLGMNSEWTLSGKDALLRIHERQAAGNPYYAIILDWHMPEMSGLETAQKIREQFGQDLPIIIFSAYDWAEIESDAKQVGIEYFIAKPLFMSKVVRLFDELQGREPESKDKTLQEVMGKQDFTGKRILLVEDNELNAEIATEILEMSGLTVEVAENGSVAVQKIASTEPGYYDLVFMDVQMPVMGGYEATYAIRNLPRKDVKDLPIIAMSANAFASDIQATRKAGMNGHIAKPLDMDQLVRVLTKFLS